MKFFIIGGILALACFAVIVSQPGIQSKNASQMSAKLIKPYELKHMTTDMSQPADKDTYQKYYKGR
jgi:hypothetical protein